MTRAALLPSPGDPFVLLHFYHYFCTVWQDEVDMLYICINSDIELDIVTKLIDQLKHPKVKVIFTPQTLGHGKAISLMLELCDQDSVVLMEDDSIVFKKGEVAKQFEDIENNTHVFTGSPRMSCPPDIAENLKKEFNLDYSGFGDKGPNFWPCFFYISTPLLKSTTRWFGASEMGDTFVKTSIELRRKARKSFATSGKQKTIKEIPQYHCSPDDEQNREANRSIFDGKCGYMHFGSLSSGIENTLLDTNGIPLKERTKPGMSSVKMRIPQSDQERSELTRRVMWWNEAYLLHQNTFGEFGEAYGYAIENVIKTCGLSWGEINNMRKMYMEVIHG